MPIAADFSIDRATGNIRYTGTTANYTVLEFYQWIRDLGDDQLAAGDDLYDITDPDIASKAFETIINLLGAANIDETVSQHLYGGSIIQADGTVYDGINIISPAGTYVQCLQDGGVLTPNFWTTGINADVANGISHRFLLKVSNAGTDIDNRRLIFTTREWGQEYDEFVVNGTQRGINVVPLSPKADLNNQTLEATIAAIADISLTEGYRSIDADADGTPENYYGEWDRGANTINTLYERAKWLTRRGTTSTLYGLDGDIFRGPTHEINVDGQGVVDFIEPEPVSWPTGTGQLLAVDDVNAASKMWIQLLTGTAPVDNDTITGGTSGATCLVNVTVTNRDVSPVFLGVSTGSALIGAYGVGVQAADLSNADRLTDLTNAQIAPPNNQSGLVTNLISGDNVIVGPKDTGDAIKYDQLTLNTTLTGGETSIVVTAPIPTDTPATGTIRVFNGTNYVRVPYTSWAGSTFTVASAPAATSGANVFISYIDIVTSSTSESFGATYALDRAMFCRVRNATVPIKTFESAVTFGSSGFALSVIRNSDA